MIKKANTNYKEVKLDGRYKDSDGACGNPLTRAYQYEYALYLAVSDLFESVRCRSMCVESLLLYFRELPHRKDHHGDSEMSAEKGTGNTKKTQEDYLDEMKMLVSRDVVGRIRFPMSHICAAEVRVVLENDGKHSFIFSDGIYGFRVRLHMPGKGHPDGIAADNLYSKKRIRTVSCSSGEVSGYR